MMTEKEKEREGEREGEGMEESVKVHFGKWSLDKGHMHART